jgi:large subunit ribosomal protein L21
MYAIIKTGGKQYTVKPGDVIQVEKLDQELGSTFDIKEVLFISGETPLVGTPVIANAAVTCVVTKQAKHRKVIVFKKKRRHSYRKFGTHRQPFTELFIQGIAAPGGKSAKAEEKPVVRDMAQHRQDRITQKMEDRRERVSAKGTDAEAPDKKAVTKKAPVKKAAAKKAPSKTAAKKAASKTGEKKTAKKASK